MSSPLRIVTVVGNPSETSRTLVLAQAIATALRRAFGQQAQAPALQFEYWEIARLAAAIGHTSLPAGVAPEGRAALASIESADLLVVATPVYKGAYTGLFKHLFDLVAPDALVDRPVLLAANGGSDRHALVVDHQLRPLFAFFRALTVPSAVYAAERDFDGYRAVSSAPLLQRIDEAAAQAVALALARRLVLPSALVPAPQEALAA